MPARRLPKPPADQPAGAVISRADLVGATVDPGNLNRTVSASAAGEWSAPDVEPAAPASDAPDADRLATARRQMDEMTLEAAASASAAMVHAADALGSSLLPLSEIVPAPEPPPLSPLEWRRQFLEREAAAHGCSVVATRSQFKFLRGDQFVADIGEQYGLGDQDHERAEYAARVRRVLADGLRRLSV
jgi:hypothetical protein